MDKDLNIPKREESGTGYDESALGLPHYIFKKMHGPEQIRVLTLCGLSTSNVIECIIQQTSIVPGVYQALSYVWGSERRPFYAIVKDSEGEALGYIPLTTNLNNALHDIWNAKELQSKVFWIDQLCIDQDAEEKVEQVALMGKIYKNADRVITYVGPTSEKEENEKDGLRLLERLNSHFEPNYDVLSKIDSLYEVVPRRRELPVQQLPTDLGHVSEEKWQWLVGLCFRDWTTRLW
jgi:heterokaryon incompatibility protein (HET)